MYTIFDVSGYGLVFALFVGLSGGVFLSEFLRKEPTADVTKETIVE